MKRAWFFRYFLIVVFLSMLLGCGKISGQQLGKVKSGMDVTTVVDILGIPYKAKRHPMGILVFIYKGSKGYHWIYFNEQLGMPTCVFKIEQQNTDDFFPSTDIQVIKKSGQIEFQENVR